MTTRRAGSVVTKSTLPTTPTGFSVRQGPSPKPRRPQRPTAQHTRPNISRTRTLAGAPAVNIRTHDMLTPQERKFLESAELGDRPSLLACLQQKNVPLNINCLDSMGRTAIEIAVDNENIEIVELLLQQEEIKIGNALLCAIREGVYRIVEMIVNHPSITKDMLGDGWSKSLDPTEMAISEYSNDVSPVMLAAHLNRFEILQMLLRKDAKIEKPHKHSCICEVCDRERLNDSLYHSLKRINTYRALASPAWISLTSSDPILSAFRLSWDLQNLARLENEFKDTYLQLSEQCKQFACDLLSQCRSTEEVIAILNKEDNANDENIDVWASKLSLSRLKLAIKYEQKMIWHEGIPISQRRDSNWNFLVYALLILLWPVLSCCYILMPKSRIGRIVRSPFMKFLYYSTSFGCFLILLTLVTMEAYQIEKSENSRASDRGATPTVIESLVVLWVFGMLWSEIKQLWEEGFTRYVAQWWNWLDFLMMCLYLCTISLRLSAYFVYVYNNDDGHIQRYIARTFWNAYEPMLVAEALFAIGNVLSFARIIYLFQISPYLGPLQISLGCMLVDVAKFCFIFALIITSFAVGLAQLYWYYETNTPVCITPDNCVNVPNVFSSIGNSYMTLLWSLFSITKVEDTDVAEEHDFTQWIGQAMFMMYHITSIIVLLNMLIAMMSHSFQTINDHADLEWKFHRTKLWMAHFDEGSSLPPPFNIILTPKAIYYMLCSVVNTIKWLSGRYHYQKNRNRATIRRPGYSRKTKEMEKNHASDGETNVKKPLTYTDIIQRLVSRFIHQTKKDMKMDGVNEDDLLEIKQDISSLRYELRDDRRKEIVRSSSHIDAVKKDIMRTMSMSTRIFGPPSSNLVRSMSSKHRTSVAEESDDYFESPDDAEIRSHESLFTTANPSPTVLSSHFELESPKSVPVVQQVRQQSIGASPLLIDASITDTKSGVTKQKPVPPLLTGFSRESQPSPMDVVEQIRNLMNSRFDQLIAQLTQTDLSRSHCLPIEFGATSNVREPHQHVQTPSSAPPRSTMSPKRIAFTITGPEDK